MFTLYSGVHTADRVYSFVQLGPNPVFGANILCVVTATVSQFLLLLSLMISIYHYQLLFLYACFCTLRMSLHLKVKSIIKAWPVFVYVYLDVCFDFENEDD